MKLELILTMAVIYYSSDLPHAVYKLREAPTIFTQRISSGKGMHVWIQMCHAVMLLHRKSVMRMWGIRRLVSKQPYTAELLKMAEF